MAEKASNHLMKSHIGIVIVDGVGFKNFVLSDVLMTLYKQFDRVTIFSGLPSNVYEGFLPQNTSLVELPIYYETGTAWFFRKLKELAHLQLHKKDSAGITYNLLKNKNTSNTKRGWLTRLAFSITTVCHSETWINRFYKLQANTFKKSKTFINYKHALESTKVDHLFFTHQRPPYIALLDSAAKELKIKTTAFIFSWDNLPSKGRMAANFDCYLVWSDLMKKELLQFYPNVKDSNIAVVGTPQFEPYVLERYEVSKEDFINKFNLNPNLKTICYSCGDVSTSFNDPLYINSIANAIKSKKIPEINFIVRTSPAEDGSRFKEIQNIYPNIKWNFPNWQLSREQHPEIWSQRMPSVNDIKNLRALVSYVDLNINMCSTMSLDCMIFGKPVINVAFGSTTNKLYHDQKYLKYSHYKRVINSGAVALAKNEDALIISINEILSSPKSRLKQQEELLNIQIKQPLVGTSTRIANKLGKWV